ncbi:SDR family oxidoreductase [Brevibacillus sp. SYP-B805]|uniref:SDR family NAD(P)-dependent oxidoreductase n=1 Tax=Brevibacillus sp. SYP-B805 TaxID=1578199 RepID=UPI0013EB9151|nr:SDR family oxidoreductase [Brevibacillus sp. SYP-B805]NGQ95163.1 SDR family oxidoreductase [Brevibacillus sp. SYP-B805]
MSREPQVVMITGASRGLGRALALAFARTGASLAICARNEEALLGVKREAEDAGAAQVLAIAADASLSRDVERFVAVAEEAFGKIDVLINNAAILGPSPMPYLLDYPEADFLEVLRVNTAGPFLVTRRVLPGMLQRGDGSIINVTSEAGINGYAGWGAYSVSKFAVEGLTKVWAQEVDGTGVRVNMVDPGSMNTVMMHQADPEPDYPLAEPESVVDVFLYLASDAARGINGQRFCAQAFDREEMSR